MEESSHRLILSSIPLLSPKELRKTTKHHSGVYSLGRNFNPEHTGYPLDDSL
jgi:hypothetical protein